MYLTTLPIGSIPPVDTDSCLRALSGISLQAGAGVVVIAIVRHTGAFKIVWRYEFVARLKYTKKDIQGRTMCQEK